MICKNSYASGSDRGSLTQSVLMSVFQPFDYAAWIQSPIFCMPWRRTLKQESCHRYRTHQLQMADCLQRFSRNQDSPTMRMSVRMFFTASLVPNASSQFKCGDRSYNHNARTQESTSPCWGSLSEWARECSSAMSAGFAPYHSKVNFYVSCRSIVAPFCFSLGLNPALHSGPRRPYSPCQAVTVTPTTYQNWIAFVRRFGVVVVFRSWAPVPRWDTRSTALRSQTCRVDGI